MRPKVGPLVAIAVLVLTFLGACGGEEEPVLTAREYAEAMEGAFAILQENSEEADEAVNRASDDLEELDYSWSAGSGKEASDLAETLVRTLVDSIEGTLEAFDDFSDELSSLRPPAHLAELHGRLTASFEDLIRDGGENVGRVIENLEDIDTDIDTQADLEEFWTSLFSPADPDPGAEAAAEAAARFEEACRELRARLEAELGTSVAFTCD